MISRISTHAFLLACIFFSTGLFAQKKDWLLKMQDPNVNFWEVQNEFNEYWKNRTDYKGNGYKVFKRWEYINEMRVAPDGKLQAPAEVMLEYERYMAEAPQNKSASGTWSLIGPLGYPSNFTSQPTGKGRVNAITFHPTDTNTIFLGSPSGGIWKSTNGGTNWSSLSSNMPYLGVSAILIHPSTPDVIYIGTGDRDGNDAPGIGVYKSTDGGATWNPANTGMGNTAVGMMLMHPSDPNTILACTHDGIFKTTNAGATWSLQQGGDFRDIKFKPGDPNIVYATEIADPALFWRSTDNGDNWSVVTTPTAGVGSRMVIGVSPANTSYVYLVQIKNTDETFKAFLKSTDSGLTFTEQSNTPNIFDYNCGGDGTSSQATYDLCIEVDRTNANIVYVGSINTWKSTNGGVNWAPVTNWVGNSYTSNMNNGCAVSVHADHHWFEWSPLYNPARLYLGHDGGISYTADGGATWTEISNDLATGQIYKIGQSAQTANAITAGFQDNGVSATINGTTFTTVGGGDGFDGIIDYDDDAYCYSTINGSLRRSTTGVLGTYSGISSGIGGAASFFSAYTLHNSDPNTLFFGRYEVWRSNNIRATPNTAVSWTAISAFTGTSLIRVMEQSAANLDMMYIFRGSGSGSTLHRSDNVNAGAGSVVWNTITKPSNFNVSDIAAHPTNENIVYATAGRNVYKSTNKGVTWTDITGNLPYLFINCLVLDKNADEGIYIGNQTGVWYKDATISEWILFSSDLPPVDVRELEIYYDANPENSRITAATYGRGVWQSDLAEINVVNPTNFAVTPISTSQIDLTWNLNPSGNNVLIATSPTTTFGVPADGTAYTAGNSLPGGGTVIYVGNLTNFSHTGLTTGATYCYKIWSVNGSNQYSAGLPPVCDKTISHNWTGDEDTNWFNPENWGPGTVPTATDGAYIPAGLINYPIIDNDGATCYHLTIDAGASVSMDASTNYTFQLTGNWTNNGVFNRGIGTVAFTGTNALQTIKGASTTNFHILELDKGALGNILEAKSLIALNSTINPLVITSGTFKLSSASTITPFTDDNFATNLSGGKGLWNNGGTINSGAFTWYLNGGLLRVSAGTVNVGTSAGNSMEYLNNGTLMVEGGALNIAARFVANDPPNSTCQYIQTGGTVTVFTVGSSSTTRAPFYLAPNASFTMSGGTIVVQRQSSNTGGEVVIASTNHNVTGGTLQLGNTSTPAAQLFRINCTAPVYNLTVNATNAPTARLFTNGLTVLNNVTISGGTLDANGLNLNVGGHWTNNGAFTAGAGTVAFNGTAAQNLGGTNATTFNNLTLNNVNGLSLSGSVNTTVNGTLNLTAGVITTGNNQVNIGSAGSVARTSGHIFGKLQKHVAAGAGISRTFELGDASVANYTPVSVTFASVTNAGNLVAQTVSGDHPQIGTAQLQTSKSVNRYWSLTNSGTTFTTCDAVFNFLATDLDASINTSSLICGKYDSPNWTYPSVGTQTTTSTEITGVSSFSDFQLAEPCGTPDVPTLSATANPICSGGTITLSIASGSLNGAADWQWYTGTCGGTSVGSGSSINVSPSSNTTYYVRGEGGCLISPGSCANSTINVVAQPSGPTLDTKTPNLGEVCSGTGVSATFNAGSGGAGCSDAYEVVVDGAPAVAYTPGATVGAGATSSVVIRGRRADCAAGSGCTGTNYVDLATWTV
ncbi:MAG: hypothetical protein JNJ90_06900, partial [Saprospiraceae bacterium]|nr:hypothetical protein [Saprospiraceae bacterium]